MPEQLSNDASTTLVQAAQIGDLTIKVNANLGFPTSGNFRIKMNSEIGIVTQVGLSSPSSSPSLTAVAGSTSYHAGTFTVGCTYNTAGGETALSPTSNVNIAAGQAIQVAAINNIPSYVTSIKYYLLAVPPNDTIGFVASQTPSSGSVPLINLTAEGNGTNAPGSSPSTVWVVTRGVEGTSAALQANGTPVVQCLTNGALTTAFLRLDGGTNPLPASQGPPTSGTYSTGGTYLDSKGALWYCSVGGTPGTWIYIGGGPYHAEVFQSSSQSISNNSVTVVTYDTVENDPNLNFTTGAGAHYTCPLPGRYLITAAVDYGGSSTGSNIATLFFTKNGTTARRLLDTASSIRGINGAAIVRANANDTLDVRAYQNSGVSMNTSANITDTYAQFTFLGS